MATKKAHLTVRGQVQGVGYRFFVQKIAKKNGLAGWVKNKEDGSVEVTTEGEESLIETFIQTLRTQHPWAKVDALEVEWASCANEFHSFDITY